MADLDFEDITWDQIDGSFSTLLEGNGHVISNLTSEYGQGLFYTVSGTVRNLGVDNYYLKVPADVQIAGSLIAINTGSIISCFTTGIVVGSVDSNTIIGGLVGLNKGLITTSYSRSIISDVRSVGGLVGENRGSILACYAYGDVSGTFFSGGLVGLNEISSNIINCFVVARVTGPENRTGGVLGGFSQGTSYSKIYWDTDFSGLSRHSGTFYPYQLSEVIGKTSSELKSPTGYTGIYSTWGDMDVIGDSANDDVWDFGTSNQHPALKIDFNGNSSSTVAEFGNQRLFLTEPTIESFTYASGQFDIKLIPPVFNAGDITSYSARYITNSDVYNWVTVDNITDGNLMPDEDGLIAATISGLSTSDTYILQIRGNIGDSKGPYTEYISSATRVEVFADFVASRAFDKKPQLPDYSYAGYHRGTKSIPEVVPGVTHTEFSVTNYGAIPNDRISDHPAIQSAINAATDNYNSTGMPGVVTFPQGEFLIFTDTDRRSEGRLGSLRVRSGHIVLKGSGSRNGGTIIRQVNIDVSNSPWGSSWGLSIGPTASNYGRITTVAEDSERESYWLTVKDASRLSVDQWVSINAYVKDIAGADEYLLPFTRSDFGGNSSWRARYRAVTVREIHQIAEVVGNRVRFHSPIRISINSDYEFVINTINLLQEVGVEDISFHGSSLKKFTHVWTGNMPMSEKALNFGAYQSVSLARCANSWVRRCSFVNVGQSMTTYFSTNITLTQLTTSGNLGHYSILAGGSTSILYALIEDITTSPPENRGSTGHGPSIHGGSSGNVIYYSEGGPKRHFDVHAGNPSYDNLLDHSTGGHLKGSSGSFSGPNHLNRMTFWNYTRKTASSARTFFGYPYFIMPIVAGLQGVEPTKYPADAIYNPDPPDFLPVEPASLYEEQLKMRVGSIPSWLPALHTEWDVIRTTPVDVPKVLFIKEGDNISLLSEESVVIDINDYIKVLYSATDDVEPNTYNIVISNDDFVTTSLGTRDAGYRIFDTLTFTGGSKGSADVTLTGNTDGQSVSITFNVECLGLNTPNLVSVRGRNAELLVSWNDPYDPNLGIYDLRYKLSSSDGSVESNWTTTQNISPSGSYEYSITASPALTNGLSYDVQMRNENSSGDVSDWTDIISAIPVASVDYDSDDDGLIEIYNFTELNAVRYDLDGDGIVTGSNSANYTNAFDDAATSMGCPSAGCTGYELEVSLDFVESAWTTGVGWTPIGSQSSRFDATFEGNGNVINNVMINLSGSNNNTGTGFFGSLDNDAKISRLGLENINIRDVRQTQSLGGLAGINNSGEIISCYITGSLTGSNARWGANQHQRIGGLVGKNLGVEGDKGRIVTSYSTVDVTGRVTGGFVGLSGAYTDIIACYSTGASNGYTGSSSPSGHTYIAGFMTHGGNNISVKYNYTISSVSAASGQSNTSASWHQRIGGLVGKNLGVEGDKGRIVTSYSTVDVTGRVTGGFVGLSGAYTDIIACYSTGASNGYTGSSSPSGHTYIAGFMTHGGNNISVKYNYTISSVSAASGQSNTRPFAFLGWSSSGDNAVYISNYYNNEITSYNAAYQSNNGILGKTTSELQSPTGHTGIYATWDDLDIDGDGSIDAPWDFGTDSQYPALKIDFNGNGTATVAEFGPQRE